MCRLIKVTMLIGCVVALAVGAATALGRLQPVPGTLATLRLTDCALPCWIGIEVGRTSRLEARERILAVFVREHNFAVLQDTYSESLNLIRITLLGPGDPAQVLDFTLATETSLAVQYIRITSKDTMTVGDLHALLGAPSRFLPYTPFPSLIYTWGDRGLRAYVRQVDVLSPTEPILYVELYANSPMAPWFQSWHGFTVLERLLRR